MDFAHSKSYRRYLLIECALSENTARAYLGDIAAFFDYLSNVRFPTGHPAPDVNDITTEDIIDYLSSISGQSKRTQARVVSSLHSYFSWLCAEGLCKENPSDAVKAPKLGTYLPAVLSVEEVERLIDAAGSS